MTNSMLPHYGSVTAAAIMVAIALTVQPGAASCVGTCDLHTPLAAVLDVQRQICSGVSQVDCLDPAHGDGSVFRDCTWSTHHGCRPRDVTSGFVAMVAETRYASQIGHMVGEGQNCVNHQTSTACGASVACHWAPPSDNRTQDGILPFGFEPCQAYQDSMLVDLLAFVFEHTPAQTALWHSRADACHARTWPNCEATSDLAWTAGATTTDFPCGSDDRNDVNFCGVDVQQLIWAMAADVAPTGSNSEAAYEAKVMCSVYDNQLERPYPHDDDWGAAVWVQNTAGSSANNVDVVADLGAGQVWGREDCARVVGNLCPAATIAHWVQDTGVCTCQEGESSAIVADTGTGEAIYRGLAPCSASGANCTDLCIQHPWCKFDNGECDFDDDALRQFATATPSDPLASWQVAKDTCAASNCSKTICEGTLGNECEWDAKDGEWGPGHGECKLFGEIFVMDEVTSGRVAWVKPFVMSLFGVCGDLENETACHSEILPVSGVQRCSWSPHIEGHGAGSCGVNLNTAFVPALPDSACGGSLAELIHSFIGCAANLLEVDCINGTHYGYGERCEWHHGMCAPSIAHAQNLSSQQYLSQAAYIPHSMVCACDSDAPTCSTGPSVNITDRSPCVFESTAAQSTASPGVVTSTAETPVVVTTVGLGIAVVRHRLLLTFPGDVNSMSTSAVDTMKGAIEAEVEASTGAGTVESVVLAAGSIKATVVFKPGVSDATVVQLAADLSAVPMTVTVDDNAMTSSSSSLEEYTEGGGDEDTSSATSMVATCATVAAAVMVAVAI